jgi:hypothetical protein
MVWLSFNGIEPFKTVALYSETILNPVIAIWSLNRETSFGDFHQLNDLMVS